MDGTQNYYLLELIYHKLLLSLALLKSWVKLLQTVYLQVTAHTSKDTDGLLKITRATIKKHCLSFNKVILSIL